MARRKTTLKMFELIDRLDECEEDLTHKVVIKGNNRVYHFEKNAHKIEKIASEMKQLVEEIRRK